MPLNPGIPAAHYLMLPAKWSAWLLLSANWTVLVSPFRYPPFDPSFPTPGQTLQGNVPTRETRQAAATPEILATPALGVLETVGAHSDRSNRLRIGRVMAPLCLVFV